jgi:hypothetical protein
MDDKDDIQALTSTTASYSRSSIAMVDSTGLQMSNPINNSTSCVKIFPVVYQPTLDFGKKQNDKGSFSFDWAGGLSGIKGTINSVQLAHETLKWR